MQETRLLSVGILGGVIEAVGTPVASGEEEGLH